MDTSGFVFELGLIVSLGLLAWFALGRRHVARRRGFEALDDPEAAKAYGLVSQNWAFRRIRRIVTERALKDVKPSFERVIDLGCGTGDLLLQLRSGLDAKGFSKVQVFGLDLSREVLSLAEERAEKAGLASRVEFVRGDNVATPFPSNHFDLAVSTLSLHHWTDPVAVLDEFYRVLKPGGRLLLFDLRRDIRQLWYWAFSLATRLGAPAALRRVGEPLGSLLASYEDEEAKELLAKSQFRGGTVKGWLIGQFIEGEKQ